MFGYVTFNVKYYIMSQIFYKKIGCLYYKSISIFGSLTNLNLKFGKLMYDFTSTRLRIRMSIIFHAAFYKDPNWLSTHKILWPIHLVATLTNSPNEKTLHSFQGPKCIRFRVFFNHMILS